MNGFPPKIVLLKTGNNSRNSLLDLLIKIKPLIEDLENNDYGLLEIINKR
jgi:predicted nuclease of predicted toxin-antitoxin system